MIHSVSCRFVRFFAAMYIIFRGVQSNIFDHPVEAMMGMFIMSLGEFGDIYESFARTPMDELPKVRNQPYPEIGDANLK